MIKILVVDDEKNYRIVLDRVLSAAGYGVAAAADPATAQLILREDRVGLVLADPGPSGRGLLDFCRRVQRDSGPIPIILFTSGVPVGDRQTWLDAGIFAWLDKPFDNRALLALVTEALTSAGPGGPCVNENLPLLEETPCVSVS